jgi:hypothetical protein
MKLFRGGKRQTKEQMLLARIEELQKTVDEMNKQKQQSDPLQDQSQLTVEIQKIQSLMLDLKRKASFQNRTIYELQQETLLQNSKIEQAQRQVEMELRNQRYGMPVFQENEIQEESIDEINKGSIEVVASDGTKWRATGYSSLIPHPDFNYFPSLAFEPTLATDGITYDYTQDKVISAIVPCYNEGSAELNRTIRSLFRQRLTKGWRVEVVIVMDGADHISDSMMERLRELFGVDLKSSDENLNPLLAMPSAETIIVEPPDSKTARRRVPAVDGTVGGYTLVVKRHNRCKANSQMWWLGPHGAFINTKYSLATDCGTVFTRTATIHLIRHMDAEPNLHAVTGFQRIMTSEMQGDGSYEIINRPMDFLLRMVQRFEFEVRLHERK